MSSPDHMPRETLTRSFTVKEQLLLHQFRRLEWMSEEGRLRYVYVGQLEEADHWFPKPAVTESED